MSAHGCPASLAAALMLAVLLQPRAGDASGAGPARNDATQNRTADDRATAANRAGPQGTDPVVDAAIALLAKRFPAIPRVYVVDPAALKVTMASTSTAAFRIWYGDRINPNIFVNKFAYLYLDARDGDACALKSLAAVLAHEVTHSSSKDELEPSRVELSVIDDFLADVSTRMSERTCLGNRRSVIEQSIRRCRAAK